MEKKVKDIANSILGEEYKKIFGKVGEARLKRLGLS